MHFLLTWSFHDDFCGEKTPVSVQMTQRTGSLESRERPVRGIRQIPWEFKLSWHCASSIIWQLKARKCRKWPLSSTGRKLSRDVTAAYSLSLLQPNINRDNTLVCVSQSPREENDFRYKKVQPETEEPVHSTCPKSNSY